MPAKPETPTEAINFQAYEQWLSQDITQKLFGTLNKRSIDLLKAAARNAGRTGVDNAIEHNNLVKAAELLFILETYEHPSKYPFPN
jgi:hypothetical protein